MELEFAGTERRLSELSGRLARLGPLKEKTRTACNRCLRPGNIPFIPPQQEYGMLHLSVTANGTICT